MDPARESARCATLPPMRIRRSLVGAAGLLFFMGCGGEPAGEESSDELVREVSSGAEEAASGEGAAAAPEAVPLPPLPVRTAAREEAREAPAITDAASARAALNAGFYEAVGAALPSLGDDGAARAVRARYLLETGDYAGAERVGRAIREGGDAATGALYEGLSLMARGRLDDAEARLTAGRSATSYAIHGALASLHLRRGRTLEARQAGMPVIEAYNAARIDDDVVALTELGRITGGLGYAHDAETALIAANRADGDYLPAHLVFARLFLSHYDPGHAEESVRDVLARNPEHAEARALLARIRIVQSFDFSGAEEEIARALAVNPNLVAGHTLRASMALRDLRMDDVRTHLDRAAAIDPNDPERLALEAAAAFLADDEAAFEAAEDAVYAQNPRDRDYFRTMVAHLEWEHRYPTIVEIARAATTRDPRDGLAWAHLGINLLRTGEEAEGRQALDRAYRLDRFNVMVVNTLNLFERTLDREYEQVARGPFVFRFHREERALLERYVPPTLIEAYESMQRRYGFTPEGPIHLEMFAESEHFSVRTTGLPNLGVQGVCFGKVITAISPSGGPFNWAQITWHELAHVFHIQLSDHHVPRWFTEGLAEYETNITPFGFRREMDHLLYDALRFNRLPPIAQMNRAFTHARSGFEMIVAYYASSQIVGFIAEEYGFEKVAEMLRTFATEADTGAVIRRVLGVEPEALDAAFRAHTMRRLTRYEGRFRVDLPSYDDLEARHAAASAEGASASDVAGYAVASMRAGLATNAHGAAQRALQMNDAEPLALYVMAELGVRGAPGGAVAPLDRLFATGADSYDLRLLRARAALMEETGGGRARALAELARATALDPDRPEAWQGILEVAEAETNADLIVNAIARLAEIDEHGRDPLRMYLSRILEANDVDAQKRFGRRAIFQDPHSPLSHAAYSGSLLADGDAAAALAEADLALELGAHPTGHEARARALAALGRADDAAAARAEAARMRSGARAHRGAPASH